MNSVWIAHDDDCSYYAQHAAHLDLKLNFKISFPMLFTKHWMAHTALKIALEKTIEVDHDVRKVDTFSALRMVSMVRHFARPPSVLALRHFFFTHCPELGEVTLARFFTTNLTQNIIFLFLPFMCFMRKCSNVHDYRT